MMSSCYGEGSSKESEIRFKTFKIFSADAAIFIVPFFFDISRVIEIEDFRQCKCILGEKDFF